MTNQKVAPETINGAPVLKDYTAAMAPQQPTSSSIEGNDMVTSQNTMRKPSMVIPALLIALVLGVGTGYLLFTKSGNILGTKTTPQETVAQQQTASQKIEVGKVYGSKDLTSSKDSAEGVLLPGGVNGEGSFHIVREGGESQNVYLTSSALDLNLFVNAKVLVKGETFKAQRAGWLMDVGQVKVEELNAQLPDWAVKAAQKAEMKAGGNQ